MTAPGRRRVVGLAFATVLTAGCGNDTPTTGEAPSFARDVAPIIHAHCTRCHRPGEAGPFSLITYDDVRKRAQQIADVTEDRFMPPWLPAGDYHEFLDERRLTETQIATLRNWADAGAAAGDADRLPPLPTFPTGWQLGEPDLVVTLPTPYMLRADGPDVFRNFVIPLPVHGEKYVEAVEFRPGNAKVVHHAVMYVDRGRVSRSLDAQDDEPGFPGMDIKEAETPDGHFLGWTPGRTARAAAEGTAWRLHPGTDLVLQLHLQPSGKVEPVDPTIGLHFTLEPPTREFFHLSLRNDSIIIPAGESDHVVEDRFTLPVDVTVLSVYPHAHFLGKRLESWAILPDGSRETLFVIPEWDFNWQDEFRFLEPLRLPAGTKLAMRYSFDNSAENVRNPNNPPKRVMFGLQSTDEMATLGIQVMPDNASDLARLATAAKERVWERTLVEATRMAREFPEQAAFWYGMGKSCRQLGRLDKALAHLEEAIRRDPDHVAALDELAVTHQLRRQHEQAIPHLLHALAIDPAHVSARYHLANSLFAVDRMTEARDAYEGVIEREPGHASAHFNLALLHRSENNPAAAIAELREAIAIRPEHTKAHAVIGQLYMGQRQPEPAAEHFRTVLALQPDSVGGHLYLAAALLAMGDTVDAVVHLEAVLRIEPTNVEALRRYEQITGRAYRSPPATGSR